MTYSQDFRRLALRLLLQMNNYRRVANLLHISTSTLHRWKHDKSRKQRSKRRKHIHEVAESVIQRYIDHNPFTTLRDIALHLSTNNNLTVSMKTIQRSLKRLRITKKKAYHHRNVSPVQPDKVVSVRRCLDEGCWSVDECYFSEKVLPNHG